MKSELFSRQLSSPTLFLQHSCARSRAGEKEQEWACRDSVIAVDETTARGCDLTDAALVPALRRGSGAERGSCRPPFTRAADPTLSQPGEVNQTRALSKKANAFMVV